eukprot:6199181-Pleurochrysis_carterae.AAC.2
MFALTRSIWHLLRLITSSVWARTSPSLLNRAIVHRIRRGRSRLCRRRLAMSSHVRRSTRRTSACALPRICTSTPISSPFLKTHAGERQNACGNDGEVCVACGKTFGCITRAAFILEHETCLAFSLKMPSKSAL